MDSLAKSMLASLLKRVEDEGTQEQICNYLRNTNTQRNEQRRTNDGSARNDQRRIEWSWESKNGTTNARRWQRTAKMHTATVDDWRHERGRCVANDKRQTAGFQWQLQWQWQPRPNNGSGIGSRRGLDEQPFLFIDSSSKSCLPAELNLLVVFSILTLVATPVSQSIARNSNDGILILLVDASDRAQ